MSRYRSRRLAGPKSRPATRRRNQSPRGHRPSIERLEDRTLLSVRFTAGPLTVPANRPDIPLELSSPLPVEPALSVGRADFTTRGDPGNIVVSSQNGLRVSPTNGDGGDFRPPMTFPVVPSGGESATVYDNQGRLFWINLNAMTRGVSIVQINPSSGIIVAGPFNVDSQASTPLPPGAKDDRPSVAVDLNNNNLYAVWTRFAADGTTKILLSRSTNQGAAWSVTMTIPSVEVSQPGDGFAWGATVSVGPGHSGDVFVAYHAQPDVTPVGGSVLTNPAGNQGKTVVVRYSNDLLNVLSRSEAFAAGQSDITFNVQSAPNRKIPLTQFSTQGSVQPWVLTDLTRPGNVYVVAADDPNNGGPGDPADVVFARSTDNGATWTRATVEAGPTNTFRLFPAATIDQFGDIVVAWYDNRRGLRNGNGRCDGRNTTGNYCLDVFAKYSTDGGVTWSSAFMVNNPGNAFNPDAGAPVRFPGTTWIGDHIGVGLFGGTAYVAWNGNTFDGTGLPVGQQVWSGNFAVNGSLRLEGDETGPTNDTILLRSMPAHPDFVELFLNNQRQYAGLWSALSGIRVDGQEGNDTINVENTVAGVPVTVNLGSGTDSVLISPAARDLRNIQGVVTVNGGAGIDTLTVNDQSALSAQAYALTASSVGRAGRPGIIYTGVQFLTLNGGSGGTLDTPNLIQVASTAVGALTTVNGGSGVDIINVGDGAPPPVGPSTISGIRGDLVVNGQNTLSQIRINDQTNPANPLRAYRVTNNNVTRLGDAAVTAPIVYSNARFLIINGSGNFDVASTSSNLTTVANAPGGATVSVGNTVPGAGAQEVRGQLDVGSFGGPISLVVNDATDFVSRTATLTATALTGLAGAAVTYALPAASSLTAIGGGTAGNTFNVQSTPLGVDVTVNAGPGDATINVGSTTNTLNGILGHSLTINGQGNTNSLNVNDQGTAAAQIYSVSLASVGRVGGPTVSYSAIQRLTLNGGSGGNTINVASTAAAALTTINSGNGGGRDIVNVGGGSVQGIAGLLTVTNTGNFTALVVDDSASNAAKIVTLSTNALTGLAPAEIRFTGNLGGFDIIGGTGANRVSVFNTPSSSFPLTTRLLSRPNHAVAVLRTTGPLDISGAGAVAVRSPAPGVGLQELRGRLTVLGATDLVVDDSDDLVGRSATLTSTALSGLAGAEIHFNGPASLAILAGGGGNTFTITNTPATITTLATGACPDTVNVRGTTGALAIDGVAGLDTVTVSNSGSAQDIRGALSIANSLGFTNLTVDDSVDPIAKTNVVLSATTLTGLAPAAISFAQTSLLNLTVRGGRGGNTFTVTGNPSNTFQVVTTVFSGSGNDTVNVRAVNTGGVLIRSLLVIDTGAGDDTINVGSADNNLAPILGNLNVNGGGGNDTLNINDQGANLVNLTYTVTPTAVTSPGLRPGATGVITYASVRNLIVNGSRVGANTFTVSGTASGTNTRINDGLGNDTVKVLATSGPLTIDGQQGIDAVTITQAGSVQGIQGPVTVLSTGGLIGLRIDDSADPVGRTATLSAGGIAGLAPAAINWAPNVLTSLVVSGGPGRNTFTVNGTPSRNGAVTNTTLDSGTDMDTVNVWATALGGPLTINGGEDVVNIGRDGRVLGIQADVTVGADFSNLTVDDSANTLGFPTTISATSILGLADGVIRYNLLNSLTIRGGHGNNLFTVASTPRNRRLGGLRTVLFSGGGDATVNVQRVADNGPLTVNAGGRNDTINVGNANKLDDIIGTLTVNGSAGNDTLNINDQATANQQDYQITATTVTRTIGGDVRITYNVIRTLVLNGGRAGNSMTVVNTADGTSTQLNTGLGRDVLDVRATTGPLTIDGQDGNDEVAIGNSVDGMQDIRGVVTVGNTGNRTTLILDDVADLLSRTATISAGGVTNLAPADIRYAPTQLAVLIINGGSGGNNFNVEDTPNGPVPVHTELRTGNGTDTVNVRGTTGPLVVRRGLLATGVATVHLGSGGPPPVPVSTLDGLRGPVTIDGAGGVTAVTVNDQGNPHNPARLYRLTATTVTRAGDPVVPGTITYSSIRTLIVHGSSSYVVENTAAGTETTINAGSGNDTVNVLATTGPLIVNAGAGDDTIRIGSGGPLSTIDAVRGEVTINGGPGINVLIVDDSGKPPLAGRTYDRDFHTLSRRFDPVVVPAIHCSNVNLVLLHRSIVNILATEAGFSTTLLGGSGDHEINIGSAGNNLDVIRGPVIIDGRGGTNTVVNLNDQGSSTGQTNYTLTASRFTRSGAAIVSYQGVQSITLNAGSGGNFLTMNSTGVSTAFTLNAGSGGDTVYGLATSGPLTLNDAATVYVGNAGSTQQIAALVTLAYSGPSGYTTLNVDDSADPAGHNITLDAGRLTGLAPAAIDFTRSHLGSLTVSAGQGPNAVTVVNTGEGYTTTLNGGLGDDTATVLATAGPLNFNGGGGRDTVVVGNPVTGVQSILGMVNVASFGSLIELTVDDAADSASKDVLLTDNALFNLSPAEIRYWQADLNTLTVYGGRGGNHFTIESTPVPFTRRGTFVFTGAGDDTVDIGNSAPALDYIQGDLFIDGQGGANTLNVNDQGAGGGMSYDLQADKLTRDPPGFVIHFANITDRFVLNPSPGSTVTAQGIPDSPLVLVNGGPGPNTLNGPNGAFNTWTITGQDSGTLGSTAFPAGRMVTFVTIENLNGGDGINTFTFNDQARLSGGIDGLGGSNTLDLTAYVEDVNVAFDDPDHTSGVAVTAADGLKIVAFANIQTVQWRHAALPGGGGPGVNLTPAQPVSNGAHPHRGLGDGASILNTNDAFWIGNTASSQTRSVNSSADRAARDLFFGRLLRERNELDLAAWEALVA